jgi:hypothetical protein
MLERAPRVHQKHPNSKLLVVRDFLSQSLLSCPICALFLTCLPLLSECEFHTRSVGSETRTAPQTASGRVLRQGRKRRRERRRRRRCAEATHVDVVVVIVGGWRRRRRRRRRDDGRGRAAEPRGPALQCRRLLRQSDWQGVVGGAGEARRVAGARGGAARRRNEDAGVRELQQVHQRPTPSRRSRATSSSSTTKWRRSSSAWRPSASARTASTRI